MEKSSLCFSTAQLPRHLVGLGRTTGRKALVLSGSLGLGRCLWPHGSQAEVLCCGGGEGSQPIRAGIGSVTSSGSQASLSASENRPPLWCTHCRLRGLRSTRPGHPALAEGDGRYRWARGLLAEEMHPSAVPGVETRGLFSLPLKGERADDCFSLPLSQAKLLGPLSPSECRNTRKREQLGFL